MSDTAYQYNAGKYLRRAGLAAILTACAPGQSVDDQESPSPAPVKVAPLSVPEEKAAPASPPGMNDAILESLRRIEERQERDSAARREEMGRLRNSTLTREEFKTELETRLLETEKKLPALPDRWYERLADWLNPWGVILGVGGFLWGLWQSRQQGIEMKRLLKESKENSEETKAQNLQMEELLREAKEHTRETQRLFFEGERFTYRMRDFIYGAENDTLVAQYYLSLATTATQGARTRAALDAGEVREERVGDFPALLPYLTTRLQAVKHQAILTLPFLQFGALSNPRGQLEFRETLHEIFNGRAGGPELVIVTYEDAARFNVAATRYDEAVHALEICHDFPISHGFRTRNLDDRVRDESGRMVDNVAKAALESAMKAFNNRDLRREDQQRIYALADWQNKDHGAPRLNDDAFLERLRGGMVVPGRPGRNYSDIDLFEKTRDLRTALREAMRAQERTCSFPKATVIKVNEKFENKLTLCIDGEEIITCQSDMTNLHSRDNLVKSTIGDSYLQAYKERLIETFNGAGVLEPHGDVFDRLERLIQASAARPTLRSIEAKLNILLGNPKL